MMEQFDSMGVLGHFSLCLYLCTMHLSLILSLLWSMESQHRAKADVCFSKQHAQSEDVIEKGQRSHKYALYSKVRNLTLFY